MTASKADLTYGNWRRPASPGIAGLGQLGTMGVLATMIVMIIGFVFSPRLGFALGVSGGLLLAPLLVHDRYGRNAWQNGLARVAWRWSVTGGHTLYRAGPLTRVSFGGFALPGLAAPIEMIETRDALGSPFALLAHPGPGHVSVVLACAPEGTANVDPDQIDQWVAAWGGWLSGLGRDPDLVAASVTIETAPDVGHRLRREVETNLDPAAPALAARVLGEIVATYPEGSAAISCRIALTWARTARPGATKRRSVDEMCVEVGRRLPALVHGLATTGAGPARALGPAEIAAAVRVAFNPGVAAAVEEVGASAAGIGWADCGPVAAEESWSGYRHDDAWSQTWYMTEAPRSEVRGTSLHRLLAPHPDVARKRVTIGYRPYHPAAAVRMVDRDHKDALFNASGRRVGRARDAISITAAEQTAAEEAKGAGLVRFGIIVTATVVTAADLPLAVTAIDHLAAGSRIRLRPAEGQQATGFLAGLPLGIVLAAHVRVPTAIRDAL